MTSSLQEVLAKQRPARLDELSLSSPLSLLVLAPHPDDFDAISVTLNFFHQRGDSIHLAVLTTGASGVEDGFSGAHTAAEKTALREAEQMASCAFFGLPPECLNFLRLLPDEKGNLRLDAANHAAIRSQIAACQPDLVFMPHGSDSNVTHQRTYALFRAVALTDNLNVWAVLNQDAKTLAMRTDLYMPFGADNAEWKAEMLRLHLSQHQRNLNMRGQGFDQRVLSINRQAGVSFQADYAELFELERFGASEATHKQARM